MSRSVSENDKWSAQKANYSKFAVCELFSMCDEKNLCLVGHLIMYELGPCKSFQILTVRIYYFVV